LQKKFESSKALNLLFGSSRHVFDKSSLGYDMIGQNEKKKMFSKIVKGVCR